jgi:PAS domain S-box-containing protein
VSTPAAIETPADAPRAGIRLPRLMLGYFALAIIFLATLALSMYLHASLRAIQDESKRVSEAWARRQADYAEIGRLGARLDAPGNDIFETRDAVEERMKLETALRPFGDAVQKARDDLNRQLADPENAEPAYRVRLERLSGHLDTISDAALAIGDEAQRIFSYFRTSQTDGAGVRLAIMNREYARLADQVAGMNAVVREIQERRFADGAALATRLARTEYLTAAVTVCFLLAMIGYGAMISRRLRRDAAARETALAEAQASEGRANAAALHARDSEERLRAVVDTAADGIITADADGVIQSWNAAAMRIFGYSAEEMLGQNVARLAAPPHAMQHDDYMRRYRLTGQAHIVGVGREVDARHRDGTQFPVELAVSEVAIGAARTFTGIVRDISARKRVEAELRGAKEAAEAATRAKSQFLANMSHEIRTPMNGIIGMTGLLLDTPMSEEQREFTDTIRASADALLTIINDILDFSKIESGHLELDSHVFDLRECVEGALDLIAPRAAEKGLDLAYMIDEAAPAALVGDVTRVRQVLVNLLGNAVKFTHHGEVTVHVTASEAPEGGGAAEAPPLMQIEFAVSDTGIGIPAERMHRLFQSFSQVDASTTRQYGGTGLGLAISKRLAELMGGRMWVTSEAGHGSCFRFTIHAPRAAGRSREYLYNAEPLLTGRPILLVDDNPTNRIILTRQTEAWGMRPYAAMSGMEALDWMDRGERFDLAILDMQMPEMDGLTLAHEIRKRRDAAALPLVLLSSVGRRAEDGDIFSATLTKPVKPSQLFDALVGLIAPHVETRFTAHLRAAPRIDTQLAERVPLRVLLAEDNLINQKVALRVLERMGYRADVAANGLEALEAIARQVYDVVLLDVQMPEMDGLTAAREICRRWPSTRPRLVAMTANAMQGDREACLAAGMDDYVSKPVRVQELQAALERSAPSSSRPAALAASGAA